MKKGIAVGIIGTGFGRIIGLNFKAVDPSTNVYFWGRNKDKLDFAVKEAGAEGTYSSWQEMINDPKIDLVIIATPSGVHKEIFSEIAKIEKHILVEKPAALNSKDVFEMAKQLKHNENIAVVNHEGRLHPVVSYMKESVKSGKLGDVMTIRVGAYLNWYSNPEYKENWNQDRGLGGGQIFSIGSHQIDLARYLLDFQKIISGSVQDLSYQDPRFSRQVTADSQFSAHFETKHGSSIQLFNDCYCFGYKDFLIEVIGSKGIITYSDQKGLRESYSNAEPLKEVVWKDPIAEVTLGNSILTKSMKYMAKALIDSVKTGESIDSFCTLKQEAENLELFEKYNPKV